MREQSRVVIDEVTVAAIYLLRDPGDTEKAEELLRLLEATASFTASESLDARTRLPTRLSNPGPWLRWLRPNVL